MCYLYIIIKFVSKISPELNKRTGQKLETFTKNEGGEENYKKLINYKNSVMLHCFSKGEYMCIYVRFIDEAQK